MWEFLVKKTFPRRPKDLGSDIKAAHSVTGSHSAAKVDSDTENSASETVKSAGKKHRKLLCPVCSVTMQLHSIGSLVIDQCPDCLGVFLDRGELRILSGVEENFFQAEDHKYLIYTPHGLTDSIKSEEKLDSDEHYS